MSKAKRTWTLMLALIMAVCLMLAGCSGKEEEQSGNGEGAKGESVNKSENDLKPVKLVWYVRNTEPKNAAAVLKKANEIISEKIKATVEFRFINPGDYENKMQLVMSSGEEYDIAFTSSWANNYLNNVSKGAYIPLDDLLAKYPALKGLFKKEVWDAVRVNGKIYGIPNNQILTDQPGLWLKKDLVEKHNIDLSKIKSLQDLTAVYQTIKDKEPGVIPVRAGVPTWFIEYVPEVEGFSVDTKTWKVYYRPEQMLDRYKVMRDWYQRGFFPQDVATLKDEAPLIKAGKIFSRYNRQKPGSEAEYKAANGIDTVNIATGPGVINKNAVLGTLSAISATSKNPERAMALINLINTDKELYNLLIFGLEGQDYTKVSANRIEKKPDSYLLPGWLIGNVFNSYLIPGQPDNVWEETQKLNDTGIIDPLIGFSFDRKNVENEIARLSAVDKEYSPILDNGLDDPEKTLKAKMEKRKAAGHDKVMAEIQRQIDEWRKTQK